MSSVSVEKSLSKYGKGVVWVRQNQKREGWCRLTVECVSVCTHVHMCEYVPMYMYICMGMYVLCWCLIYTCIRI